MSLRGIFFYFDYSFIFYDEKIEWEELTWRLDIDDTR